MCSLSRAVPGSTETLNKHQLSSLFAAMCLMRGLLRRIRVGTKLRSFAFRNKPGKLVGLRASGYFPARKSGTWYQHALGSLTRFLRRIPFLYFFVSYPSLFISQGCLARTRSGPGSLWPKQWCSGHRATEHLSDARPRDTSPDTRRWSQLPRVEENRLQACTQWKAEWRWRGELAGAGGGCTVA